MSVAAIVRVIAAEANDVQLEAVLPEHSRLVREGVPTPKVRAVIAGNVNLRVPGEQVGPLKKQVEGECMEASVTLGLSKVVHVVNHVTNTIGRWTEDNEHQVVHLFPELAVLIHKVSEDEHLTWDEVHLNCLDIFTRGRVVLLMATCSIDTFSQACYLLPERQNRLAQACYFGCIDGICRLCNSERSLNLFKLVLCLY